MSQGLPPGDDQVFAVPMAQRDQMDDAAWDRLLMRVQRARLVNALNQVELRLYSVQR